MQSGMLWSWKEDKNSTNNLLDNIKLASNYFSKKYEMQASKCEVNPTDFSESEDAQKEALKIGIEVTTSSYVLKNSLIMGSDEFDKMTKQKNPLRILE